MKADVVILGAGPGGLTAACKLLEKGKKVIILEKNSEPGGWMRPVIFEDFSVDFGYKHIYSRIPEVDEFWRSLIKKDLKEYTQRTGVLFNGRIFEREKEFKGVSRGVPFPLLFKGFISWMAGIIRFGKKENESLEDYFYRKNGKLFTRIFLQNYDEKLKGRKWSMISASKAPGLKKSSKTNGLISKILNGKKKNIPKDWKWYHPLNGTGEIASSLARKIGKMKGEILYNAKIIAVHTDKNKVLSVDAEINDRIISLNASDFISSFQLETNCKMLNIPVPLKAHSSSRSVILVYFFLKNPVKLCYQSIQVATKEMYISRITNYNAFRSGMVPEGKGCICAEIFCMENDDIMKWNENRIMTTTAKECVSSGIFSDEYCFHSMVIKCKGADPGACWEDYVLEENKMKMYNAMKIFNNFYHINRTGSDKSTFAAILASEAIVNGNRENFFRFTRPDVFDPWKH